MTWQSLWFCYLALLFTIVGCTSVDTRGSAELRPDTQAPQEPLAVQPAETEELRAFANQIRPRLEQARYLEGSCELAEYPGWEGFPTELCSYSVSNKDGSQRSAEVVVLNPSADKLAVWIQSACRAIEDDSTACWDWLFEDILSASGGQFPVAGIVYEDILPKDGLQETYAFRDGVTVRLRGLGHRITRPLNNREIEIGVDPTAEITTTFKYARVQSTTQEEYAEYLRATGSPANPESEPWNQTIRRLYQDAWNAQSYELLNAKAGIVKGLSLHAGGAPRLIWLTKQQGPLCIRHRNFWCLKQNGTRQVGDRCEVIVDDPWQRSTGFDKKCHATFNDTVFAARAFFRTMFSYRYRYNLRSTQEIFDRYAPASDCIGSVDRDPETGLCPNGENPTVAYARSVAALLGKEFDEDIQLFDEAGRIRKSVAYPLARAVAKFELGGEQYHVEDWLLDAGLERSNLTSVD